MRLKDIFNPKKWKSVSIWGLRKATEKLDNTKEDLPPLYIVEQLMFRKLSCGPCIENFTCIDCGCNTEGKMRVGSESCSLKNWPEIMDEPEWEDFKYEWGIVFDMDSNFPNTFKSKLESIPMMGEVINLKLVEPGKSKRYILPLPFSENLVEDVNTSCGCLGEVKVVGENLTGEFIGTNYSEAQVAKLLKTHPDGKVPMKHQITLLLKDGRPLSVMDKVQGKTVPNRDKQRHVITLEGFYQHEVKKEDENK